MRSDRDRHSDQPEEPWDDRPSAWDERDDDDALTDEEIETLAEHWPWPYEETRAALNLAEQEGWPLLRLIAGLDALAEDFPADSDPSVVVQAAIDHYQRRQGGE